MVAGSRGAGFRVYGNKRIGWCTVRVTPEVSEGLSERLSESMMRRMRAWGEPPKRPEGADCCSCLAVGGSLFCTEDRLVRFTLHTSPIAEAAVLYAMQERLVPVLLDHGFLALPAATKSLADDKNRAGAIPILRVRICSCVRTPAQHHSLLPRWKRRFRAVLPFRRRFALRWTQLCKCNLQTTHLPRFRLYQRNFSVDFCHYGRTP